MVGLAYYNCCDIRTGGCSGKLQATVLDSASAKLKYTISVDHNPDCGSTKVKVKKFETMTIVSVKPEMDLLAKSYAFEFPTYSPSALATKILLEVKGKHNLEGNYFN